MSSFYVTFITYKKMSKYFALNHIKEKGKYDIFIIIISIE